MTLKSLTELCLLTVIDNLDLIGDVGDTDLLLLGKILVHCNVDQLQRIEDSTEGRDLSAVTDELWLRCYARKYGAENMATVQRRMKSRGVSFKWRALYDAKLKEQEETQQRCVNRLKELYLEAEQQKQSRQVQLVNIAPPGGRKRKFTSDSKTLPAYQAGGSLMKKARLEFAKSHEKMIHTNIKKRPLVPPSRRPCSVPLSRNKAVSRPQPASQPKPSASRQISSSMAKERVDSKMGPITPPRHFSLSKPPSHRLSSVQLPSSSPATPSPSANTNQPSRSSTKGGYRHPDSRTPSR